MDYQDLFWSELDRQDLLCGLCGGLLIQPPLRIRVTIIHYPGIDETKQFSDKCYCTSISNLTGVWLWNKLRARVGESNLKMITFLRHMCSIDPPVWEEVWQTYWDGVQSPAEIRNRQLGLSSIILSFGKHAQPFPFTSHIQPQSHRALAHTRTHTPYATRPHAEHTHYTDIVSWQLVIMIDVMVTS